jgi:lysozyme family protein
MSRSDEYMPRILKHEGGFVDHPRDPGGATNKGVTIGTLKRLGMDLDGDGDVDVSDLKRVSDKDAAKVFKKFYGDAVQADLLPRGLDYAMTDFAVNSGPTRAAEHLQRILGVPVDGHIGPMTLAAMKGRNVPDMINDLCDSRLRFLRALSTWGTFGRGWQSRVDEVRRLAGQDAVSAPVPAPTPAQPAQGFWATLFQALLGIVKGR